MGQAHVYLLTHPASALLREWSHSVPNQVPSFMEIPRPLPVPLLAVDTVWAASTNLRMPLSRCGNAEMKFPELWHPVGWGQLLPTAPAMKYFCHSFLSLFEDSEFHPHLHTHTHTHTVSHTHPDTQCHVVHFLYYSRVKSESHHLITALWVGTNDLMEQILS